jgi:hypothetical protein
MTGYKTNSGENLIVEWRIPVQQARYHKDGSWFMPLERFPAALCDPKGYVVFETQRDYETSQYLQIGQRVHVQGGIYKLPRYVRVR